jgi:hypothetical protein
VKRNISAIKPEFLSSNFISLPGSRIKVFDRVMATDQPYWKNCSHTLNPQIVRATGCAPLRPGKDVDNNAQQAIGSVRSKRYTPAEVTSTQVAPVPTFCFPSFPKRPFARDFNSLN